MTNTKIQANSLDFGHISWKSYNTIKKKAMEQEFSWSGLLISLSIAFFIVISCAQILNLIHQSAMQAQNSQQQFNMQMYRLEPKKNDSDYLYTEYRIYEPEYQFIQLAIISYKDHPARLANLDARQAVLAKRVNIKSPSSSYVVNNFI